MVAPVDPFVTALRQYQAGHLADARRRLDEIVASQPEHAEAWHLLGVMDFQQGRWNESVQHFHRAVRLDERSAKFLTNLGSAWHALGELREAADCFERALAISPRAETQTYLGIVRLQQHRLDEAEACLHEALSHDPQSAQARLNLGNVLRERGRLDDAAEQYEQAVSHDPDSAEALLNLGEVRCEQSRFADAVEPLRCATKLRPRVAEIHFRLADALRRLSDHASATASYQRALSFQANSFDGWMGLGESCLALQRWEDAANSFQTALALQPQSAAARAGLTEATRQGNQNSEAT